MKKIYRTIAKKYGVTVEEIEREIREAIAIAYVNPTSAAQFVPRQQNVPTSQELITYVAKGLNCKPIVVIKQVHKKEAFRI